MCHLSGNPWHRHPHIITCTTAEYYCEWCHRRTCVGHLAITSSNLPYWHKDRIGTYKPVCAKCV